MIAIVDYGAGNLHSVRHALERVGAETCLARHPDELIAAERIVLPGVGAFGECIASLRASGMIEALADQVRNCGKPFLGICLGMQMLARESEELGRNEGLGWLDATVRRLAPSDKKLKIPHVGWNEVNPTSEGPMWKGLRKDWSFYFVHSYRFVATRDADIAARCDYGGDFVSAVQKENIFACQFHPEKSQQNGLQLLENFLRWSP